MNIKTLTILSNTKIAHNTLLEHENKTYKCIVCNIGNYEKILTVKMPSLLDIICTLADFV